jgi:predicted acylesterase/phospholipase RssA
MRPNAEPDDLVKRDYSRASRHCDVVMKGGIASGVVYPLGVCELAGTYRFKNVGGTSAGAIAAAATAAAEYGREGGGFGELAKLPDEIGAPGKLGRLFQADPSTRGLFRVLMAKVGHGFPAAFGIAVLFHLPTVILGALPGAFVVVLAGQSSGAVAWIGCILGVLLALLGAAVALAVRLAVKLMRVVPKNDYGLCSGWSTQPDPDNPPLTGWLSDKLNGYAGLTGRPGKEDELLTFGHLWAGPGGEQSQPPRDPGQRHVQLAMMTTNLTNRRAHQLPWDSEEWFFSPEEFGRLFPPEVVEWMRGKSPGPALAGDGGISLRPLPAAKDMPVIVATRLSLSFPILLSAVPLWRREGSNDPERCWFSDGGISSNFPVHFFDRLVPRWPTFAINLRQFRSDGEEVEGDQSANVAMVKTEEEAIPDWWYRLPEGKPFWPWKDHRLFEFLAGIVRTMQNRIDEAQMRVPGYRDRVAHVYLRKDQGGMNLAMDEATIKALAERGRWAAEDLRVAYTRDRGSSDLVTWDSHRWTRLRSALGVLEDMHGRFADGYTGEVEPAGAAGYADLVGEGLSDPALAYHWADADQRELAKGQIAAIEKTIEGVGPDSSVATGAPDPPPEGRVEPRD